MTPVARRKTGWFKRWNRLWSTAQNTVGAAQDALWPPRRNDFGDGFARPVFMLHGFGAPRQSLHALERRLRRHLGISVMSFNLKGLGGALGLEPMEHEAMRLGDKLERQCIRRGVEALDVVGHSRGGLLLRHMVTFHPVGKRVRTFIALGSPFAGAPLAIAGTLFMGLISRTVRDLMPFSTFTRNLRNARVPPHITAVSISAGLDVVAPPALCHIDPELGLPGHVHNHVVPGVGHNGLLVSQRTFALVKEELRAGHQRGSPP